MKTKSPSLALCAIVLLTLWRGTDHKVFASESLNITGATLNAYGVYRRQGVKFQNAPETTAGRTASVSETYLLQKTDTINATVDTTFGIEYTITGDPPNAEAQGEVELVHPEIVNPSTGKTSTVDRTKFRALIGVPTFNDVNLDQPWNVIAGKWTFRLIYQSRVLLEKSFDVKPARAVSMADGKDVDGVRVYGMVDTVTDADVREAVADFKSDRSDKRGPSALEVLNSNELHAYLPERDVGWIAIRRLIAVGTDGRKHPAWTSWGRAIQDAPEVCRLMRNANQVFAFPVILLVERRENQETLIGPPHRDDKRLRLLGTQAHRELVRLVGYERNWFHGIDDTIWVGENAPTNVGFVFRREKDELVLFFTLGWRAECIMPNGEHLAGSLEEKPNNKLEAWKKRYAQSELAAK